MKRPNGSGNILKLSGNRRKPWAVRVTTGIEINEDGKVVQKWRYIGYFEKRIEALSELEKYNTSPTDFVPNKPVEKKQTFTDIYNLWLEELSHKPKPLSKSTMDGYRAAYKKLDTLHDMVFERITVKDIEDSARRYQNMSGTTMKNIKILIRNLYKTAMRYNYATKDLSELISLYYTNENARPHSAYTMQEIALLWHHKNEFWAKVLLILIYTGMRIEELLSMKSKNVHLKDRYMVGGVKTEAGKNRKIPISEKIAPFFNTSGEYLIMHDGKRLLYEHARNLANEYLASLNMEHQFHDTRHTTATLLEEAKIPLLHRKLILGHATTDVTDMYTHVSIRQLIDDINKI